jgi:lipid-binding SYLF domain-containing protein
MKSLSTILIITCLSVSLTAQADWTADSGDKVQVKAEQAIAAFRERVPRTAMYFEQAYGFAIFPSVTRVGFGFGGAYGKGVVIDGSTAVGMSKYWQFTSGIQAGARNFSMIIFFKDKEALEYYQAGNIQFMGQAGVAFGTVGAAGTPAYNVGVAVVTLTRFGVMGEFTISGARFSYKPLETK